MFSCVGVFVSNTELSVSFSCLISTAEGTLNEGGSTDQGCHFPAPRKQ